MYRIEQDLFRRISVSQRSQGCGRTGLTSCRMAVRPRVFWNGHMRRMSPNQVERDINAPLINWMLSLLLILCVPCFQQRGSTIHFDQIMDNGEVCLMFLAAQRPGDGYRVVRRSGPGKAAYQYYPAGAYEEDQQGPLVFGRSVPILEYECSPRRYGGSRQIRIRGANSLTDDSSVPQRTIKLKCWNSQAPLYPFG